MRSTSLYKYNNKLCTGEPLPETGITVWSLAVKLPVLLLQQLSRFGLVLNSSPKNGTGVLPLPLAFQVPGPGYVQRSCLGSDAVVVQKLKKLVKVTVALGLRKSKADRRESRARARLGVAPSPNHTQRSSSQRQRRGRPVWSSDGKPQSQRILFLEIQHPPLFSQTVGSVP